MEAMNVSEEEDEPMMRFGMIFLVKRRSEIPADLYADVKYIFHTSYIKILSHKAQENIRNLPPLELRQRKLTDFELQLDLPRRLPRDHKFSNKFLVVLEQSGSCSAMVFLIDWCQDTGNVSMFHVVTKRFKDTNNRARAFGCAAIGERLYFVCGGHIENPDFSDRTVLEFGKLYMEAQHPTRNTPDYIRGNSGDALWGHAVLMVENSETKHLNFQTYNLKTRAWETRRTPCLNTPKHNPVAFAHGGKLFALRGHHDFKLLGDSPPFEFLDTNCPSPCWTDLPAPPFDMKHYQYYILDEENGVVYFYFKPDLSFYSVEPLYCCQLNLREKPYVWSQIECKQNAHKSKSEFSSHPEHFSACIVDGIIFSYEYECDGVFRKPVIRGRYVGCDTRNCKPLVVDGLDAFLEKKDQPFSGGILNHIGKYRFCLMIRFCAKFSATTEVLYFLIFDLVKEDLPEEFRTIKTRNGSKAQKANRFKFNFKFVCEKSFQVPNYFTLQFCKNM